MKVTIWCDNILCNTSLDWSKRILCIIFIHVKWYLEIKWNVYDEALKLENKMHILSIVKDYYCDNLYRIKNIHTQNEGDEWMSIKNAA